MVLLKQWEPFGRPMPSRRFVDRLFEDAFARTPGAFTQTAVPFDLYEEGDSYVFSAALPGVNPGDVDVTVKRGLLTVAGKREAEANAEGRTWHFRGLPRGSFQVAAALPGEVEVGAVEASYDSGLLTVRLPKAESAKVRKIAVRAGAAEEQPAIAATEEQPAAAAAD